VTPTMPETGQLTAAAEAKDGKVADPPAEAVAGERKLRAAQPGVGPAAASQGRKKTER
jgi:hypothetical protein